MKYHKAAVGGTFDHFHAGHKQLLRSAMQVADSMIIGITTPQLFQGKPLASIIEPLKMRKLNVQNFIQQTQYSSVQFIKLSDPFGPTLYDQEIDILVVSELTMPGAIALNQKRQQTHLPALPVITTPMVRDEVGQYISSTQIRRGRINRQGKVYAKLFDQDIIFSSEQRNYLKKTQGPIVARPQFPQALKRILIGDVVTQFFLDHHEEFDYAIVDGQSRRQVLPVSYPQEQLLSLPNPAGQINHLLAQKIIELSATLPPNSVIRCHGEEDLLAFVPILTEPLESLVFYGQPDKGLVMIRVTEAEKDRFAHFINPQF